MSKARELAELGAVYDSGALSNRNFIINGAMQIWQSGTTAANNAYGADRWRGTSVTSQAQSTDVPNASFAYSNAASGSGGLAGGIGTPIELPVTGKSAPFKQNTNYTFSGFFKGTSGQTLSLRLRYRDGMLGANSQEILAGTVIVTFDGTWQYVTKTVDFGSSVDVVGTSKCLELLLIHNTADATWYQTGCQLELGTEATPFEHRSFGQELALCQRYFSKSYEYGTFAGAATGIAMRQTDFIENNQGAGYRENYGQLFPVRMRAAAAVTIYDSAGTVNKCNYYIGATSTAGKTLSIPPPSETTWGGYSDRSTTIGGWSCHFIADAEL